MTPKDVHLSHLPAEKTAPGTRYTLGKAHRLCSQTAIDRLFAAGQQRHAHSALAYPLRAVWIDRYAAATPESAETAGNSAQAAPHGPAVKFLISIPKKRLRKAVDRVLMRRRVREAYRLLRHSAIPAHATGRFDLAFIYVADKPVEYQRVSAAVAKILRKIFQ